MNAKLTGRLNQILPKVTSEAFRSGEGIGNEIAFYIFDYPAGDELQVREHIQMMMEHLESRYSTFKVLHLNLLDVMIAYLDKRGYLEKALMLECEKGDDAVFRALKGPLSAERLRDFIAQEYNPAEYDLVLMSGIGSVWPVLRAHTLLNCMHRMMGRVPLVMFYPGNFDGTSLRLFGKLQTSSESTGGQAYYRAFTLIPNE